MKKILVLIISASIGWASMVKAQNGWEQLSSMKIAKGGSQSCVIDRLIYVFGGCNSSMVSLNSAEAFCSLSVNSEDLLTDLNSNVRGLKD